MEKNSFEPGVEERSDGWWKWWWRRWWNGVYEIRWQWQRLTINRLAQFMRKQIPETG